MIFELTALNETRLYSWTLCLPTKFLIVNRFYLFGQFMWRHFGIVHNWVVRHNSSVQFFSTRFFPFHFDPKSKTLSFEFYDSCFLFTAVCSLGKIRQKVRHLQFFFHSARQSTFEFVYHFQFEGAHRQTQLCLRWSISKSINS